MNLLRSFRQSRTKAEPEAVLGYYLPPEDGAKPVAIKNASGVSYGGASAYYQDGRIQASPEGFAYAFTVSTWAYKCTTVRAKNVGKMPWRVVNVQSKQTQPEHPLAIALNRNRQKLLRRTEFSQVLFGETFLELVRNTYCLEDPRGQATDLNWLNNLGMQVDTATGVISAFNYSPVQGGKYQVFSPADVAFMRTDNPFDDLRGLSPFLVILDELGIDRDVARVVRAFFANDMRLGTMFIPENPMQKEDRERFWEFMKANYQGARNAGKPVLLSHPMKEIRDAQQRPELDDMQLRESTRRDICAALGVPLAIAGAWDDANYDSVDTQRKSFYEETIMPECDDIADFINTDVRPAFDPHGQVRFEFDYSKILALTEDTNDRVTKLNNKLLSGGITLNRYREQIGEKPLGENGEVFYIPTGITVTPVAKVGQMPAPQPSPFGGPAGGLFQQNPPLVQNPPAAHALVPAPEAPKQLAPRVPQKAVDALPEPEPLIIPVQSEPQPKVVDVKAQDTPDDELAAWEKKALNGGAAKALGFICYKLPEPVRAQVKAGLAALDKDAPRAQVKAVFGAARVAIKEPVPTDTPAPDEYQLYWRDYDALQQELGADWINQYMARALDSLSGRIDGSLQDHDIYDALSGYRGSLADAWVGTAEQPGPVTRLILAGMAAGNESVRRDVSTNPIKAIGLNIDWMLLSRQALDFARNYAFTLIKGLDDTTREQVRQAITAWLETGAPLDDLKQSIEAVFDDPVRAQVIAATESARAYNGGAIERYRSLDITQATLHTQRDGTVCAICEPLNGVVADISVGWPDGKDGYTIPPIHVGCRCYTRPVVN